MSLPENLQNILDSVYGNIDFSDTPLAEDQQRPTKAELQEAKRELEVYRSTTAYPSTFERDPNIFFNQYGVPVPVYLEIRSDIQMMGDPNLLGDYYFWGGSKGNALYSWDQKEAENTANHEVNHAFHAHSETQHRYMESKGAFNDPRNILKIKRQIDPRYH